MDKLIAAQAHHSPDQNTRDEFEVLTALILYYEQYTRIDLRIEEEIRQPDNNETLTEAKSHLSRWLKPL